jgi:hypothetical protein
MGSGATKNNDVAPDPIICSITLETLTEENSSATIVGSIYKTSAIRKWLKDHNTDPATNIKLPTKRLYVVPKEIFKSSSKLKKFRKELNTLMLSYKKEKRKFDHIDMTHRHYHGENLDNESFYMCSFYDSTYFGVDLSENKYILCFFRECIFKESDLSLSIFNQCRFDDCLFVNCNFHDSKFFDCTFYDSELIRSNPSPELYTCSHYHRNIDRVYQHFKKDLFTDSIPA